MIERGSLGTALHSILWVYSTRDLPIAFTSESLTQDDVFLCLNVFPNSEVGLLVNGEVLRRDVACIMCKHGIRYTMCDSMKVL
jgi:hypothetical protein